MSSPADPPALAPLSDAALDQLFRTARSRNRWTDKAVPETMIRAIYDLLKMGPTAANQCPARYVWVHSDEAKERLKPHLSANNVVKVMTAPWCVIIAHDLNFPEKLPYLFPHNKDAVNWFKDPKFVAESAFRNGTLEAAYLMMAARSLGLDCGPMSGFNNAGVDQEFFLNDPARASWRSNFLCCVGYGSDEALFPRLPRLSFEETNQVL